MRCWRGAVASGLAVAVVAVVVVAAGVTPVRADAGSGSDGGGEADLARRVRQLERTLEETRTRSDRAIADLQAELDRMRGLGGDTWLDERRAEEVRALVRDVLADADTRASLLQDGAAAGYDNGFFIGRRDDVFTLTVNGLVQVRWLYDRRHGSSDADDDTGSEFDANKSGFEIARGNLYFSGHAGDPRLRYFIAIASNSGSSVRAESAWFAYDYDEHLSVYVGRFRNRAFLREERLSYVKQLAVERSYMNEEFSYDYTEGIGVNLQDDTLRVQGVLGDGAYTSGTPWQAPTGWAVNGRFDYKIAGTWEDMETFTALGTEGTSSVIGAAIAYEQSETGTTAPNNSFFSWTVDGSLETGGLSLYAAVVGRISDNESGTDYHQYGFMAQAGYLIDERIEPYVQYQYLDWDGNTNIDGSGVAAESLSLLTGGVNYYIRGQAAKVTLDVTYAFDEVPRSRPNTGLLQDLPGEDGQLLVRTQFQLWF